MTWAAVYLLCQAIQSWRKAKEPRRTKYPTHLDPGMRHKNFFPLNRLNLIFQLVRLMHCNSIKALLLLTLMRWTWPESSARPKLCLASASSLPNTQVVPSSSFKLSEFVPGPAPKWPCDALHMGIWWPHQSWREMHQSLTKLQIIWAGFYLIFFSFIPAALKPVAPHGLVRRRLKFEKACLAQV